MDDDDGHPFAENVVVLLIAMGSAAFVVSMYHCIAICLCNQHITDQNQPDQQRQPQRQQAPAAPTPSLNQSTSSVAQMIPTHKYQKKKIDHVVSDGDQGNDYEGGTCAVCLGDFEEGEELRTLPECMHSFHVPCIDMWLYSHTSCPICRASATPSPASLHHGPANVPSFGPGDLNAHHSIDMVQIAVVQSGLVRR